MPAQPFRVRKRTWPSENEQALRTWTIESDHSRRGETAEIRAFCPLARLLLKQRR